MDAWSRIVFISFFSLVILNMTACEKENSSIRASNSAQPIEDFEGDEASENIGMNPVAPSLRDILEDPSQGKLEQSVGIYWGGTLINAQSLGNTGPGFFKIFLSRDTAWTSSDTASVIRDAAEMMTQDFPGGEPLEIGDMTHKNGGVLYGHASHQNGLDSDIRYFSKDGHVQNPNTDTAFDEIFVKNGRVTEDFDVNRNWHILHHIVGTGRVNRIFVDPVIKETFCAYGKSLGLTSDVTETLRRLRPLASHDNHFHLRITCPLASPRCERQVEIAAGSGC